jgi:hypothetical protein
LGLQNGVTVILARTHSEHHGRASLQEATAGSDSGDTMLRMRILLILPALLFASCGTQDKESQHAKVQPVAAAQPEPEVTVATTVAFTEGPAQGPDGLIYFSDIANNRILRFEPQNEEA